MNEYRVDIIGSGPAGLAAALYLARAGYQPVVFEQFHEVGAQFQGDFQALENGTADDELSSRLAGLGIQPNFRCVPFTEAIIIGPRGREYTYSRDTPLFYLVERGRHADSLDQGLKQQALAAGAEIRSGLRVEHSEARNVIVTRGAQAPSAIARGLVFETTHPDGFFGFVGDATGPSGYSYMMIHEGRATFVSVLFEAFSHSKQHFDTTLSSALGSVPIDMYAPRSFGGYLSLNPTPPWTRDNRYYYAGERAGFQHALWGFDLRLALLSGVLAARAMTMHEDYEALSQKYVAPAVAASLDGWHRIGKARAHETRLEELATQAFFPVLPSPHEDAPAQGDRPLLGIDPSPQDWPCRDEEYACLWHEPSGEQFVDDPLKKPACTAGQRCTPLESYYQT